VDTINRYFASDKCCGDFNPARPSGIGDWGTTQLRFYGLFNSSSGLVRGKLDAAAQANLETAMWRLFKKDGRLENASFGPQVFQNGSQNRYVPSVAGYLLISQWLRKNPAFASQKLNDGSTLESQYQAWRQWMSKFLDLRVRKGLWSEVGIGYENNTVDGIVNV